MQNGDLANAYKTTFMTLQGDMFSKLAFSLPLVKPVIVKKTNV